MVDMSSLSVRVYGFASDHGLGYQSHLYVTLAVLCLVKGMTTTSGDVGHAIAAAQTLGDPPYPDDEATRDALRDAVHAVARDL